MKSAMGIGEAVDTLSRMWVSRPTEFTERGSRLDIETAGWKAVSVIAKAKIPWLAEAARLARKRALALTMVRRAEDKMLAAMKALTPLEYDHEVPTARRRACDEATALTWRVAEAVHVASEKCRSASDADPTVKAARRAADSVHCALAEVRSTLAHAMRAADAAHWTNAEAQADDDTELVRQTVDDVGRALRSAVSAVSAADHRAESRWLTARRRMIETAGGLHDVPGDRPQAAV